MAVKNNKELVVIIDQEAQRNSRNVLRRWFPRHFHENPEKNQPSQPSQQNKFYEIETPVGDVVGVYGTRVMQHDLGRHGEEYLYFEINDTCNFHCRHCGIKNSITHAPLEEIISEKGRYLTDDFLEKSAEQFKEVKERQIGTRKLFYGGGEPLINPGEFARVDSYFKKLEKTERCILTNGCSFPLGEKEFSAFVKEFGIDNIVMTYTENHIQHYARLSEGKQGAGKIPHECSPKDALKKKIEIISRSCKNLGIFFLVNVVEDTATNELAKDLRLHIIKNALSFEYFQTEINGHRGPCSQGYELSIRSNGRMYPHCYDVFNGLNYLGMVGLMEKSDEKVR